VSDKGDGLSSAQAEDTGQHKVPIPLALPLSPFRLLALCLLSSR
jgi:hypothetical protein